MDRMDVPDEAPWRAGADPATRAHVKVAGAVPNDGDMADLIAGWVQNEQVRQHISVEDPATLYGFD